MCTAVFSFTRRSPLVVAATGSASGLFTWLITWAEGLTKLFQFIGGFFGCLLAVVSLILILPRFVRFISRWRKAGLAEADRE